MKNKIIVIIMFFLLSFNVYANILDTDKELRF
jgi:hypothetical protein